MPFQVRLQVTTCHRDNVQCRPNFVRLDEVEESEAVAYSMSSRKEQW